MQKATREVVVSASLATLIMEAITAAAPSSLFADWMQQTYSGGAALAVGGPVLPRLVSSTSLLLLSSSLHFFFLFAEQTPWQMRLLQASHEMTRLPAEVMINSHRLRRRRQQSD